MLIMPMMGDGVGATIKTQKRLKSQRRQLTCLTWLTCLTLIPFCSFCAAALAVKTLFIIMMTVNKAQPVAVRKVHSALVFPSEEGGGVYKGGGLLLATLPRHCYTFHYEFSSSKACRNNAQLLRPRRIFQFSCSNSCHIDVLSAACCQLSVVSPPLPLCSLCLGVWSDACCRLSGVWWGMECQP